MEKGITMEKGIIEWIRKWWRKGSLNGYGNDGERNHWMDTEIMEKGITDWSEFKWWDLSLTRSRLWEIKNLWYEDHAQPRRLVIEVLSKENLNKYGMTRKKCLFFLTLVLQLFLILCATLPASPYLPTVENTQGRRGGGDETPMFNFLPSFHDRSIIFSWLSARCSRKRRKLIQITLCTLHQNQWKCQLGSIIIL